MNCMYCLCVCLCVCVCADQTDFLKYLVESESDPLSFNFSDKLTLPGEDSNKMYPGILQCVSESDVMQTVSAIAEVYCKIRLGLDEKKAFEIISSNDRYIREYERSLPDDVLTILSDKKLSQEHRLSVIRYALVRCTFPTCTGRLPHLPATLALTD
jgi:hypothetical protein